MMWEMYADIPKMPTINDIFKTNVTSKKTIKRSSGVRGYLPQERASYGAKRRQMDLDVSLWWSVFEIRSIVVFVY